MPIDSATDIGFEFKMTLMSEDLIVKAAQHSDVLHSKKSAETSGNATGGQYCRCQKGC